MTSWSMSLRRHRLIVRLDETCFDDLSDEVDGDWERITQDPVKRVAFERECIEDELTEEKRVVLLQDNPSSRSHCSF